MIDYRGTLTLRVLLPIPTVQLLNVMLWLGFKQIAYP